MQGEALTGVGAVCRTRLQPPPEEAFPHGEGDLPAGEGILPAGSILLRENQGCLKEVSVYQQLQRAVLELHHALGNVEP